MSFSFRALPLFVGLILLPWRSRAAEPIEDVCDNESSLFCQGLAGSRLVHCLDRHREVALPPCKAALERREEDETAARELRRASAAAAGFSTGGTQALEFEARLLKPRGSVTVHTGAQAPGVFAPAKDGLPLEAGDLVRTGADGFVDIVLDGQSAISLDKNSEFTVGSLDPARSRFDLRLGMLVAKVKSLLAGRTMEFKTPMAVAAIRGTELAVAQDADKPARVCVFDEGKVAVRGSGAGEVMLQPNQETHIASGKPPEPAGPMSTFSPQKASLESLRQRVVSYQKEWKPMPKQERQAQRAKMTAPAGVKPNETRPSSGAQHAQPQRSEKPQRSERREPRPRR